MNSLIMKHARTTYTKSIFTFFMLLSFGLNSFAWEVDLSRRSKDFKKAKNEYSVRLPASMVAGQSPVKGAVPTNQPSTVSEVFRTADPTQDIVIMNTEAGFVPDTLRLRRDQTYKIHVVNVNQKDKNVSFILDAFSEHHATFFGDVKSFTVRPKTDGIFSYQSPETAFQGRIIVYGEEKSLGRKLASEGK